MGTRVSTIPWKSGQIIPGASLRFVRDTGKRNAWWDRLILVKCVPHGNCFEAAAGHLKDGHTASCKCNQACIVPWKRGEVIAGTSLRFIRNLGRDRRLKGHQNILVECLPHRNRFVVSHNSLKTGESRSCLHNEACVLPWRSGQLIDGTGLRFIRDTGKRNNNHHRTILVECISDKNRFLTDLSKLKNGHTTSCGCKTKWESENGGWGSQPECFVMNYLFDLGVPYEHDGKYNHGTNHRWDLRTLRKTIDGRRFLIEITNASLAG